MKHFKLTTETKVNAWGVTLFRIQLTIDCKWGKVGDNGGFVEKEENIYGNAWVYGDAQVSGNACVYGNARVCGDAGVSGNARVYGDAQVYGDARVSGNARVCGNAQVYGNAWVYGDAQVCGDACVYGDARVCGDAWVSGDARVYGDAWGKSPLQIQGTNHFFCICKNGFIQIGCKAFEFKYWKDNFEQIGKEQSYTDKQIKEYGLYIDLAIALNT